MSTPLQPHELQHARPPCPSPTPRVHPNPCPLCWWCHPTSSSSVVPFSSCPQSFPASRSFPMSQLFTSGGQSIRVSASTSVPPLNTQDWSPLRTLILLDQGSILRTLFNLNYLPNGPMSKYSHVGGVGILTYEFWGITDIQTVTPFQKLFFFFFFGCTAWHTGS